MARPLASGKQSIDLAKGGVPGSRIRRDPPKPVKEITIADRDERDTRAVVIGIVTFALAIVVIALAFMSYTGWTPRDYTAYL